MVIPTLAKQFGIPNLSTIQKWVKTVDKWGFEALRRRRIKQQYFSQFKQDVTHYYLNSGDSYLDVALQYGLNSGDLLYSWHQIFLQEGIEGLSPKQKGRLSMSNKKKKYSRRK
ncbi:transposase [Listeria welshimeri]|nr:transposase [Listeria welshimeri]